MPSQNEPRSETPKRGRCTFFAFQNYSVCLFCMPPLCLGVFFYFGQYVHNTRARRVLCFFLFVLAWGGHSSLGCLHVLEANLANWLSVERWASPRPWDRSSFSFVFRVKLCWGFCDSCATSWVVSLFFWVESWIAGLMGAAQWCRGMEHCRLTFGVKLTLITLRNVSQSASFHSVHFGGKKHASLLQDYYFRLNSKSRHSKTRKAAHYTYF